jgi:hypothetical protein
MFRYRDCRKACRHRIPRRCPEELHHPPRGRRPRHPAPRGQCARLHPKAAHPGEKGCGLL